MYNFNVALVADQRVPETFSKKIRKHQQLSQMLFSKNGIEKTIIIQVILLTSETISNFSCQILQEVEMNIKWDLIVNRELIIHKMKDLCFT